MKVISLPLEFDIDGVKWRITGIVGEPYTVFLKNENTKELFNVCGYKMQDRLIEKKII